MKNAPTHYTNISRSKDIPKKHHFLSTSPVWKRNEEDNQIRDIILYFILDKMLKSKKKKL